MPARRGGTRKKIVKRKPNQVRAKSSKLIKRRQFRSIKLSPGQIKKKFAKQAIANRARSAEAGRKQAKKELIKRAKSALKHFKPGKTDKGQLVFISSGGKRNPHQHGRRKSKDKKKVYDRKGYLVYVTNTGKKRLIHQHRYGYKATTFANIQPPLGARYSKSRQKIYEGRARKNKAGRVIVLQRGSIVPTTKSSSFTEPVVNKFAQAIENQLKQDEGQKRFNIKIMIKLTGIDQPIVALIPIDKPDHSAIEHGGIVNFVKKKLYAHMSSDLAAAGYVTAGSSNHIKSLPWNSNKKRNRWEARPGVKWDRWNKDVVTVDVFEWKFEKNKFTKSK